MSEILLRRAFDDPTASWRDMGEVWLARVMLLLLVLALMAAIAITVVVIVGVIDGTMQAIR